MALVGGKIQIRTIYHLRFFGESSYFSFINLIILLRFTAKIVIAPCISIQIRPDDDATS